MTADVKTENSQYKATHDPKGAVGPRLTRRRLLAGTGQVALLATTSFGCVIGPGIPFADGTFWDDGTGWVDY